MRSEKILIRDFFLFLLLVSLSLKFFLKQLKSIFNSLVPFFPNPTETTPRSFPDKTASSSKVVPSLISTE